MPRTGTRRSEKEGRRWDVYAFVARRMCFAWMAPRGVCSNHFPFVDCEVIGVILSTGVFVCRFIIFSANSFRMINMTSL